MTPNHHNDDLLSARGSRMQARYPDLLDAARDDGFDPADNRLLDTLGALDALYAAPTAPEHLAHFDTRSAPTQLIQREGRSTPRRLLRAPAAVLHTMPRWAAIVASIALVGVLGMSAAAYALLPQVNQPPALQAGPRETPDDSLFTQINQTQKAAGYDLTLERGYADANNVVMVYTITADGSQLAGSPSIVSETSPTMTTPQGATLTWTQGTGTPDPGGVVATLLWFDAAPAIADDGETAVGGGHSLSLRFHSAGFRVLAPSGNMTFLPAPMTFSFTLPLRPGRVAHPHIAVHSAGATLTLDTVVVSETATDFYLGGLSSVLPGKYDLGMFVMSLAFDGHTLPPNLNGGGETRRGSYDLIDCQDSFYHFHGRWTLTLTSSPASPRALKGGKWVFNFVVP